MSDYPILVARWDAKHPADLAICLCCDDERTLDPAAGDPLDLCLECHCGGAITFKYLQADQRRAIRSAYYDAKPLSGCCSRRCMLVAEYAETLQHRGPA